MPTPVASRMQPRSSEATHSMRSCPYGCCSSAAFRDSRTPINAISVANTSDSECTASDTMAGECPAIPAYILNATSATFPAMPTVEIWRMIFFSSIKKSLPKQTMTNVLSGPPAREEKTRLRGTSQSVPQRRELRPAVTLGNPADRFPRKPRPAQFVLCMCANAFPSARRFPFSRKSCAAQRVSVV